MTHWTDLPIAVLVRPVESRPEYLVHACPSCKSTESRCLKEWGYYERTAIVVCECAAKYIVNA